MNTLHFVKFERIEPRFDQIVFLVTVASDMPEKMAQAAEIAGRARIADWCGDKYALKECTPVCTTPDTIEAFEPC